MRNFQPWDDSWHEQIVYIMIPHQLNTPVEVPSDFTYPVFLGAMAQGVQGEDFWQAIAGSMIYVVGHDPNHSQSSAYLHWLKMYNPALAKQLNYDGADQASKGNLPDAIWLLQAAVLLEPMVAEAHYNLGLAYFELGARLKDKGKEAEGRVCLEEAAQYFKNALELDPKFSLAYYNLGFTYKKMGLKGESEKYLEKGLLLGLDKLEGQARARKDMGCEV